MLLFKDIHTFLFCITLILSSINVILVTFNKLKLLKLFSILTLLTSALSIFFIYYNSGHLPMSGNFEKMQNIVFILILVAFLTNIRLKKVGISSNDFWYIAIILFSFIFLDKLKIDDFYYLYDNIWVILFFQLRIIAISFLSYSLSLYISALRPFDNNTKLFLIHEAENYTILGATIFLGSEFAGSVWAQLCYGDAWRWSKNFFTSACIFILCLVAGHLAPKWTKNKNKQIIISMLPLVLILLLFCL